MKSKLKIMSLFFLFVLCFSINAQSDDNNVTLDLDKAHYKIGKNIYGHFSEHLGHCIYGGFWVGEDSSIPNVRGIRTDVVEALKKIQVPLLRWPGGCFADEYHWMDGIGPRSERPTMINTNWGGVTEDNSFGTHEFLDLCEQIGCEPYFSGNLGSGTVRELSQWVEYVNSDNVSPMTELRKKNGSEKPWSVKYWGIGNESWGCGGDMEPEYYSHLAKRFGTFVKDYRETGVHKIAVGPNGNDYNWSEVVMRELGNSMWGMALHYYTWNTPEHATDVTEKSWYNTMQKTLTMEELVNRHSEIMDKYDPGKSVALVVDEWGMWHAVEPGTNPGFLYQQNTLRDALVAGINLNIFNNHCDRVKMAAIAQVINVLQSVILTKDEKMILTPTYHVFDMYKVHQDAIMIPAELQTDSITTGQGKIPTLSISSSLDQNGKVHITLCNLNVSEDKKLTCNLNAFNVKSVTGQILTSDKLNAHNTFDEPKNIGINSFDDFNTSENKLEVNVPKHSVVALELTGKLELTAEDVDFSKLQQGLTYNYYEGIFHRLPDFYEMEPVRSGTVSNIVYPEDTPTYNFALTYAGYIKIEKEGLYDFYLASDDGSKLNIDNRELILNDGTHAIQEKVGSVFLTKGYHKLDISFFQQGGEHGLNLKMKVPDGEKKEVVDKMFFHIEN
ncbi:MAG: alpha-L-arabinofuranosidase C-terminal domain-containing protein [Ignavibacteria bacterium]